MVSHINYFSSTDTTSQDINENKTNNLQSSNLNTNLTYSEPLSKTVTLVLNYGVGLNNASADRSTFDAANSRRVQYG